MATAEAHYLTRVLRLKAGDDLAVFDGRGHEWLATVSTASSKVADILISELLREEPRPTPLILVQSWLKGSAMDLVVQKATELGVTQLWLLNARRSNVKLDDRRMANKLSHLARVVSSAAEQCESLWVPALERHQDLASVLSAREVSAGGGDAQPPQTLLLDLEAPLLDAGSTPVPTLLLVGPEGGWAEEEHALAAAGEGVVAAGLGALTLRAETAPLAALSAIRHGWGWQR